MGRKKETNFYTCPRCGYETMSLTCINRHMYKRKNTCSVKIKDIELTEDIKKNVIMNRIYRSDDSQHVSTTHNIIVQNTFNIIDGIDIIDKVSKYINHNNMYLIPLEDYVSSKFETHKEEYSQDDLCQMVHDVTNANGRVDEMNILYDENNQSIKIYDKDDDNYCNKTWFEKDIFSGIKSIVRRLQLYCWDVYENFLIRKIERENGKTSDYSKKLDEYYKFIGTIEVEPFAYDKNDNNLLYSPYDDAYFTGHRAMNRLSLKYYEKYKTIRDSITLQEKIQLFAVIFGRIKEVNLKNIIVLNKKLSDLIGVDRDFQEKLLT